MGILTLENTEVQKLKEKAKEIRRHIIRMTGEAQSGHPGGSLSAVEILTALYFKVMRHDPKNPRLPERDRFILSKGHATPVYYATLAEAGYIDKELLLTYRKIGSILQGHPSRVDLPDIVEVSTGSVGQGLSVGNGIALAGKLDKKNYRVFVLLGDGECQEGQVWEAAMAAAHYKLNNVTAIVDRNGIQNDWFTEETMQLGSVGAKFASFEWKVREVDGHSMEEVLDALDAKNTDKEKPYCVVAHTIKGKGVSFMENNPEFHGKAPSKEQVEKALLELQ